MVRIKFYLLLILIKKDKKDKKDKKGQLVKKG